MIRAKKKNKKKNTYYAEADQWAHVDAVAVSLLVCREQDGNKTVHEF